MSAVTFPMHNSGVCMRHFLRSSFSTKLHETGNGTARYERTFENDFNLNQKVRGGKVSWDALDSGHQKVSYCEQATFLSSSGPLTSGR